MVRPATDSAIQPQADEARGDIEERGDIEARSDIEGQRVAHVPLIGRIAAGGPILAEQSIEDVLPLPRDGGGGELLSLRSSATP